MPDFIATDIWLDCYHYRNSIHQGGHMVYVIVDQLSSFFEGSGLKEVVYKFVGLEHCV